MANTNTDAAGGHVADELEEIPFEDVDIKPDYLDLNAGSYRPIKRKLEAPEKRFIAWCEQFYYMNNGTFPKLEQVAVALKLNPVAIKYFMANTNVLDAFRKRGIDAFRAHFEATLSTEQIATAIVISNFADDRPIKDKLSQLGVHPATYNGWLQNKTFRDFCRKTADQALENIHHEAVAAFMKLIQAGDFQALKYYFEITGYAKNDEVQNVQLLLQRVIEAIQKHVHDADTIARIALDINAASGMPDAIEGTVVEVEYEDDMAEGHVAEDPITKSLRGES